MAKTTRTLSSKAAKPKTSSKAAKPISGSKAVKKAPNSRAAKPAPTKSAIKPSTKRIAKAPPRATTKAKPLAARKKATTQPVKPKSPAKKAALRPTGHTAVPIVASPAAQPASRPARSDTATSASDMVSQVVVGIREKKGYDIAILNLTGIHSRVTDYFVICTGGTDRQTQAIADSVEETLRKQLNERPWRTEGAQRGEWILMDYVNVVVHIMQPQSREFYMLEELWGDAQIQRYAN